MPGESILVIDDSMAVQDMVRAALTESGYRVATAANGAAAMTYPDIEDVELVVMGSDLAGLTGPDAIRVLKQHGHTHPIPVLLLVPEETVPERENLTLGGACGFLLKPFDAHTLVRKVEQILDQKNLDELANQYLSDAADRVMDKLAEERIAQAIERKTELIIQRCIQKVTLAVDDRAREEVQARVDQLTSDKEQELVKLTVREVANSMVEKLAASKVEEAMSRILEEQTERAVRREADTRLPNLIREKTKEIVGNLVPREIDQRLQKAAERMVPDISQQIVGTVEGVAQKQVPRAARELLPPIVETQVKIWMEKDLPRRVHEMVDRELNSLLATKLEPSVRDAAAKIRKSVLFMNLAFGAILVTGLGGILWFLLFGPAGDLLTR